MAIPTDIYSLPLVIQKMLVSYLQSQDLSQGAEVSKLFQRIMNDNGTWVKVAQEFKITLKDPKNAKKELQEIFGQINSIALSCLNYEEKEKLSKISDPFVLNHEIEESFKKNAESQKTLKEMNERIFEYAHIDVADRQKFLNNPDALTSHRQIGQYIRSRAEGLQPRGIEMLESVLHQSTESTGHFWELGINTGIFLIQNGMIGNNPKISDRGNIDYWTEALRTVLGWRKGYAVNVSEPLFHAVLNQFKKAEVSADEKKVILNNLYRLFIDNPAVFHDDPIKALFTLAEPDEDILAKAMVNSWKNGDTMGKMFIDQSTLSKDKLLRILDTAEKNALAEAREKTAFEDSMEEAFSGERPSHVEEENRLTTMFMKLRIHLTK